MTVPPREAVRRLPPDLLSFLAVGGVGYVVDVAAFNVLRSVAPFATADPSIARSLAVVAAMVVTYIGNRTLTWGPTDADPPETFGRVSARRREIALFVLFNVIGLGFSVVSLVVSHDLLGLTSRWSDNISANVVGLALGTVFRYLTYRHVVFAAPPPPPEPAPDGGTRVVIVSASMAAGHDGAAAELARRAAALGCRVHRIDLLDLLPLGTGWLLRTSYRLQLRVAPRTWGWLLPLLGRAGRARSWSARVPSWLVRRRLLLALDPAPGMVVSTYPLASQALSDLRSRGLLACPAV
ncbi:MAG: GtrA family protein, partial [Nocardioides sp.]|nr:GtrA family protein [Nocardioides sp.]